MALGELKNGIGPDAYAIYQQVLAAVVKRDHPVGSLYISENPTSPAELYGGTWERVKGKFIMGASDTYPAGSTGGSATHTQTINEIASHEHSYSFTVGNAIAGSDFVYFRNGQFSTGSKDGDSYKSYYATTSVGKSKPMNILNPYYSMYIWRRVA